jgi:2-polyprenyl-6-methoxyphenol hydroxylase-like FAD-dependent oxidoreductase
MKTRTRYDAIVVGARVAGAATAMLLARRGLQVLCLDRGREGSDTVSTHALMRAGVQQLHRWGLLERIRGAGTPPVKTTTFHYGEETIEIPIKSRGGVDALYGPRRTMLDSILVDAAREAGAIVQFDRRVLDVTRDCDGRVNGVVVNVTEEQPKAIRARIVIGADGIHSRVAYSVGALLERQAPHAGAAIYGYVKDLERSGYHWYYGPGVSAGTIPTNGGDTCVFVAMSHERFRDALYLGLEPLYRSVLREAAPELAGLLENRELTGRLVPFAGERGFLRRAHGKGWALVGDAGYFKDPITAHGISDAFMDAELLVNAIGQGSDDALEAYERVRNARAEEFMELSDRIGSYTWTMEELKTHHLRLSELMGEEMKLVRSFDSAGESTLLDSAAA